jgi:hypothetical protein
MSEMSTEQAAFRATAELQLTAKAFNELRARYLTEIMQAPSADEAWRAVLALRALNSVTTSLQSLVDTGTLEKHYEENPNG